MCANDTNIFGLGAPKKNPESLILSKEQKKKKEKKQQKKKEKAKKKKKDVWNRCMAKNQNASSTLCRKKTKVPLFKSTNSAFAIDDKNQKQTQTNTNKNQSTRTATRRLAILRFLWRSTFRCLSSSICRVA